MTKTIAYNKLWKSKQALVSIIVLMIWILTAVFAYLIAPDNSQDANMQMLEIQSAPMGYTQLYIKKPGRQLKERQQSLLSVFMHGKAVEDEYIPIRKYEVKGSEIFIWRLIDQDSTQIQRYRISEMALNGRIEECLETNRYLLGTDQLGRDIFSRLLIGTRITIAVGLIAVLVSLLTGVILGLMAGYYQGRVDAVVMYLINITWSIPTLLLVFGLTMALGKGMLQVFVAVGLTMWVSVARLLRNQVKSISRLDYVEAARVMGFSDARIMFRHILPNCAGTILVAATANFASAIMIESGLSFLGLGVQAPQPSWGLMMREQYNFLIAGQPMSAIIPGLAMMSLVLACNGLSNGLRDVFDVREPN